MSFHVILKFKRESYNYICLNNVYIMVVYANYCSKIGGLLIGYNGSGVDGLALTTQGSTLDVRI